jgi:hypothetical protein
MAKAADPFIAAIWESLIAAKLPPGGNDQSWEEVPVRVRNRFIKAVRQAMQSPAALRASS